MNSNKIKKGLFDNNFALAIFSIIIAVAVWFTVSISQFPSKQITVDHIVLSTDLAGTIAEANGLSVINCDVEEVKVELLGKRTQVGNITSDNLVAYLDADNVTTSGTKKLSIKVKSSTGSTYEVKSIRPSTATVLLDKIETREFPVIPYLQNITYAEGMSLNYDEIACVPNKVKITGPSATLDTIDTCNAVLSKQRTLDQTLSIQNDELQLYTVDDALVDQSSLEFSSTSFNITIPVIRQKTVPLKVGISGTPNGFDQEKLLSRLKLSADSVVLASDNIQDKIPDELELGKIPLSDIDLNYTGTFQLSKVLPDELTNVSELENVIVSFDGSGLIKKNISIDPSKVEINNITDNSYTYSLVTQSLDVSVIGPEEIVNEITADDIKAEISFISASSVSANSTTEQYSANVNYTLNSAPSDAWLYSSGKVILQRVKNDEGTT